MASNFNDSARKLKYVMEHGIAKMRLAKFRGLSNPLFIRISKSASLGSTIEARTSINYY